MSPKMGRSLDTVGTSTVGPALPPGWGPAHGGHPPPLSGSSCAALSTLFTELLMATLCSAGDGWLPESPLRGAGWPVEDRGLIDGTTAWGDAQDNQRGRSCTPQRSGAGCPPQSGRPVAAAGRRG